MQNKYHALKKIGIITIPALVVGLLLFAQSSAATSIGTNIVIDGSISLQGGAFNIKDNAADALDVQQGTNNYLNIDTSDSLETIALGSTASNAAISLTTGPGKAVTVSAGAASSGSEVAGGGVTIVAGQGDGSATGGNVIVNAGTGGTSNGFGGAVTLNGGNGQGTGTGGNVSIGAGSGGLGGGTGANVIITGGTGRSSSPAGSILLRPGLPTSGATGFVAIEGTSTGAHLRITQNTVPTIVMFDGGSDSQRCGTSPAASVATSSTDAAGSFTITAGTGSPGLCRATITFNKTYAAAPKMIVLTPSTSTGPAKNIYVSATAAGSFTVTMATNPAAAEANTWYYFVVE